jgi:hypothetical protein
VPVTIIIPFHKNIGQLGLSLSAARRSMQNAEILIAADGAQEDCRPLAAAHGAIVIDVAGPSGPATARNRAAALATGDVLLFVDTDVVARPDALPGMCRLLEEQPDLAGVFGAYDLEPPERNFMSQFKNLSHAYVHEIGAGDASTFWAGLGAIRTAVFRSVGGFDERFRRPSVEDIDLGYRVVALGHTLRLDPRFRGTHLKRWTLSSSIVIDIAARGIPWTQLIHRSGTPKNQLNLSAGLRLSVVCAYALVISVALLLLTPWSFVPALAALLALVGLNFPYYRWFARQRGPLFALRTIPAHVVHHLGNGVSFVIGTTLYAASRAGWPLPGALSSIAWTSRQGVDAKPAPGQG